jgi:hypothetical protein
MKPQNDLQTEALSDLSDEDLIRLRARLRREMRHRGIADAVGAIGEHLAINHMRQTRNLPKLQQAPPGTKNVDALSRNGDRYSIKTICDGKKTGTVYPDSDDKDRQLFEYMLIVMLDEDWELTAIYQLPWNLFVLLRAWDKRMNAWYIAISRRVFEAATVLYRFDERKYD